MPVSEVSNISPIVREITLAQPKSIVDLGVGYGKYGVLAREVLDIVHGRIKAEDWQANIVGYEAFADYMNPCWDVYNKVVIQDFTNAAIVGWDMVLMIDSLEHIEKQKGAQFLAELIRRNKTVIVSCPNGDYPQGAVNGNEYERHRAVWRTADLMKLGAFQGKLIHLDVCSVVRYG